MTDTEKEAGTDPVEQEASFAQDEEIHSEKWDNELPEDDFHDTADFQEEPVDEVPAESPFEGKSAENKRGKTVLFGAMVVGVLLLGGLAYVQFGGSGSAGYSMPHPLASVLNMKEMKKAEVEKVTPLKQEAAASTTGKVDMDSLYKEAQQQISGKTALPNEGDKSLIEDKPIAISSDLLTSNADVKPSAAPSPELQPIAPEQKVAKVEPLPVPKAATQIPMVSAPTIAAAEVEGRLNAMTSQIEALKKALDQSAAQNAQLVSRLDSLQLKSLQEPASTAAVQEQPSAQTSLKESKIAKLVEMDSAEPEAVQEKVATPKVVKAPHKKAKPVYRKKQASKKKAVKVKVVQATGWVLRAATPEAAWISTKGEGAELRRLAVGETLPGFGKVKEIRQKGDSWEVVGTSGTLR